MGLTIQPEIVLFFALGLALLYGLGWLLLMPLKKVLRLFANSLLGALALFLTNTLGAAWGFSIIVNPFVALLVGFLGIPGVALSAMLQWLL